MKICRVIGKVDSSVKLSSLQGQKLLVVQDIGPNRDFTGRILLCADRLGAGSGDIVAVTTGSSVRMFFPGEDAACDAAIVGIIDHMSFDTKSHKKS